LSNGPKEITPNANKINVLAAKSAGKEITSGQGELSLGIEKEGDFGEIGMGVLSDGTPYLSQRGLSVLCGVENAHIGTNPLTPAQRNFVLGLNKLWQAPGP
jgi:hypothetical protein